MKQLPKLNLNRYQTILRGMYKHASTFLRTEKVLTVLTSAGVIATGYLAYKHGTRVEDIKNNAENEEEANKKLVKSAAPAVVCGLITTGMVWVSHASTKSVIDSLLISATAMSNTATKERNQVIETYGEPIEITVAKKKFDKDKIIDAAFIDGGEEEYGSLLLFYDPHFECYFQTTMNRVQTARLAMATIDEPVACGYWGELLGLPNETCSSIEGTDFGWNPDYLVEGCWEYHIKFDIEKVALDTDDGARDCYYIHYLTPPVDKYWLDDNGEPW